MLESTPLYGGNADYLEGLYEQYLSDPASVPEQWRGYFDGLGPRPAAERAHGPVIAGIAARATQPPVQQAPSDGGGGLNGAKQAAVSRLIQIWSNRGHLIAKLDPLGLMKRERPNVLDLSYFGLSEADLDSEFFTATRNGAIPERMKLRALLASLEAIYGGSIGAEFAHVSDSNERLWLQDQFQAGQIGRSYSVEERRDILWQLTCAEGLERYLHTKYVGQRRFSLEGGESLIPLLDDVIQQSGVAGVEEMVIGMAHRGRLNVLVNLLGKAPRTFSRNSRASMT